LWNKEEIPNSEGTAFENRKLKGLRSRSRRTEASIWIGKEGASKALVSQVENQLKIRELVKVKVQRSALQEVAANDFAKRVAASTGSTLVEIIGHTFTLYKKRENRAAQRNLIRRHF
jgi:RNA-binding protein